MSRPGANAPPNVSPLTSAYGVVLSGQRSGGRFGTSRPRRGEAAFVTCSLCPIRGFRTRIGLAVVRDDVVEVDDVEIAEPDRPEPIDVGGDHALRRARQLRGVGDDGVDPVVVGDRPPSGCGRDIVDQRARGVSSSRSRARTSAVPRGESRIVETAYAARAASRSVSACDCCAFSSAGVAPGIDESCITVRPARSRQSTRHAELRVEVHARESRRIHVQTQRHSPRDVRDVVHARGRHADRRAARERSRTRLPVIGRGSVALDQRAA